MTAVRRHRITLLMLQAERRARVTKHYTPEPEPRLLKLLACLIATSAFWLLLAWSFIVEATP